MTRRTNSCTLSAYMTRCCACVPQPVRFREEQKAPPQEQQQQSRQSQQSVERKVEKQVMHTTKQGELTACVCSLVKLCSFHMSVRSMNTHTLCWPPPYSGQT